MRLFMFVKSMKFAVKSVSDVCVLFMTVIMVVNGQGDIRDYRLNPYYDESPRPYQFSYNALLDDGVGQSSRTETGDGAGRVQGSYSLTNDEGHSRVVDYVADENGFRATVRTNEPGTESKNPADVVIESSAAGPYQYAAPIARPVLNVLDPVAPVVAPIEPVIIPEPVGVPEPLAPVRRPIYRRPGVYSGRFPARQPGRRTYA